MLDLRAFLTEVKNLKRYNLKKFAPKAAELKEYGSFEGYSFVTGDQFFQLRSSATRPNLLIQAIL